MLLFLFVLLSTKTPLYNHTRLMKAKKPAEGVYPFMIISSMSLMHSTRANHQNASHRLTLEKQRTSVFMAAASNKQCSAVSKSDM